MVLERGSETKQCLMAQVLIHEVLTITFSRIPMFPNDSSHLQLAKDIKSFAGILFSDFFFKTKQNGIFIKTKTFSNLRFQNLTNVHPKQNIHHNPNEDTDR